MRETIYLFWAGSFCVVAAGLRWGDLARYPAIELVTRPLVCRCLSRLGRVSSTDVWEQTGRPASYIRLLCFWSLTGIAAVLALSSTTRGGCVNSLRSRVVPTSDPAC